MSRAAFGITPRTLLLSLLVLLLGAVILRVAPASGGESVFPGQNGKIVVRASFVVGDVLSHQLATVNADGSRFRVIQQPRVRGDLGIPRWSPDGKRLAVSRRDDLILAMNADGTNLKTVFGRRQGRTGLSVDSPSWLPDGKRIAFMGYGTGGGAAIYTIGVNGTGLRKVRAVPGGENSSYLQTSPDGRRFAFVRRRIVSNRTEFVLNVVRADGSGLKQVATGCLEHGIVFDWSPDSKRLVGSWSAVIPVDERNRRYYPDGLMCDRTEAGIYIFPAAGGNLRRIYTEKSDAYSVPQPAFSPDSKKIAFIVDRVESDSGLPDTLIVMNADGGGVRIVHQAQTRLVNDQCSPCAGYWHPSWQRLPR